MTVLAWHPGGAGPVVARGVRILLSRHRPGLAGLWFGTFLPGALPASLERR